MLGLGVIGTILLGIWIISMHIKNGEMSGCAGIFIIAVLFLILIGGAGVFLLIMLTGGGM